VLRQWASEQYRDVVSEASTFPDGLTSRDGSEHRHG
jgi:hypothetical protein